MFKPYSSTGRGGKLPVRLHFVLGRRSRAAGTACSQAKRKRICRTMVTTGRKKAKHCKGKGMVVPAKLLIPVELPILAKLVMPVNLPVLAELPTDMLNAKQADAWLQVHPMPMEHLPGMVVGLTPPHWSPHLTAR